MKNYLDCATHFLQANFWIRSRVAQSSESSLHDCGLQTDLNEMLI